MQTTRRTLLAGAAAAGTGLLLRRPARAAEKTIIIGMQNDRTGPTQIVGNILGPATHHYIALINKNGGLDGYHIEAPETDTQYQVPPAIEEYEHAKQMDAVSIMLYGTPQTEALAPRLDTDHIPGTCPGFGPASASNGAKFPYVFPIAANYWSQGAAAVQFVKEQLGNSLHGKKIAFLFYDNPAGREPLPILHKLKAMEGFELKEYGVPPPGIDCSAQALEIAGQYRPDFVISHVFGRATSVSIKALKGVGFPLSKVVGFVWASAEADIMAAGGWADCQGYHTMQFAGVGDDYPVIQQIKAMFKEEGKPIPDIMNSSVYYNRGLLQGALHIEAIRLALHAGGNKHPDGADVRKGFESISGFSLGGLVPPLHITATDHEGGGWVQIYQVTGNSMVRKTPWFHGYRDIVEQMIATAV
ncbi:MAG TPA: ABC transporter substrate-binding protein [Acetobacteraceae bacterium]|nr:ABC transporter substrate-binding protein [Acetobacteraceae bacterium]